MRYYVLKELAGLRGPDILNYSEVINYRAFRENQPYRINKRNICIVKNPTDFGDILLTPFPLFSEMAKEALDLFLWECEYKEYDFLSHDRSESFHYYLPFFRRISGGYEEFTSPEGVKGVSVTLKEAIPEDIPIVYVDTNAELLMIVRLDLIESLLRRGVCSVQMMRANIKVGSG